MKLYNVIELFYKQSREQVIKLAIDPIATNKTELSSLPDGFFSPDDTLETYNEKQWGLYYTDIRKAHYDRYVKLFSKLYPKEEAERMAEEKVKAITTKQRDKSINSHKEFVSKLKELDLPENARIIAPGSGAADEHVIAPEYNWQGREYQENLVNLSNQRNKMMNLNSSSEVWSFLNVGPEDEIGDDWEGKINYFDKDNDKKIDAIYMKHACGGITDGSLFRAVQSRVPRIFVATCCAPRYPEVSWRVLNPTNDDGSPMSLEDYKALAKQSKRQDEQGVAIVDKIDSFRQKYLESNGYNVERGRTSFGPYIKAWL